MIQDYNKLIQRISKSSGLGEDEIKRKIEAKRAKLSGLISKEGAAQVVAAELGINFDNETMKISELMSGMKKANVIGKITRLFPVVEYDKNGRKGKVANFILADETGNTRGVLWDTNHIALIENEEIKEGDVVEIQNSSIRNSEVHLTSFSDIKKSQEKIENVITGRTYKEKRLNEIRQGESITIRAFIVRIFGPRFFEVCPECSKKVEKDAEGSKCKEHGKVVPEKRALLNLILDDGTGNIRSVIFSGEIENLGLTMQDLESGFEDKRDELMGKEMRFSGVIRKNKMYENLELTINNAEEIDVDKLIEKLEK